jgi:hypothetical protein
MAVDWQAFATAFLSDSAKYISENKDRAADYRDKITEQAEKNKGIFTKRKLAASSILQQVKLAEGLNATPGMIRSALSSGPDGIVQLTQNLAKMKRELEADGGNWTAESALLRVELPEFFVSGAGAKAPSGGYKSLVDDQYGVNVGEIGSTKAPEVSGFRKALGFNAKEFVRSSLDEDSAFGTGMSTYDLSQIDATAPYTFDENQQGFITYKAVNEFGASAIAQESKAISRVADLIQDDARFKEANRKIKEIRNQDNPERNTSAYTSLLSGSDKLKFDQDLIQKQEDIKREISSRLLNTVVAPGMAKYGKETYLNNATLAETINSVSGDPNFVNRLRGVDQTPNMPTVLSAQDFNSIASQFKGNTGNTVLSTNQGENSFTIKTEAAFSATVEDDSGQPAKLQRRNYNFTTDASGQILNIQVLDRDSGEFITTIEGEDLEDFLRNPSEIIDYEVIKTNATLDPDVSGGPGTIKDLIIGDYNVPKAVAWGVTEFEKFYEVAKADRKYFNEDGTITAAGIDRAKQFYTQDAASPLPGFRSAFQRNSNVEAYKLFGATVGEAYNAKVTGAEAPAVETEEQLEARLKAEAAKIEQAKLDAEAKTERERLEKLKLAEESAARVKQQELKEAADAKATSELAAQALIDKAAADEAEAERLKLEQAAADAAISDPDVVALSNWESGAQFGKVNSKSSNLTTRNTYIKSAITRYLTDRDGSKPSTEEVIALTQKYIEALKTGKFD